MLVESAVADVLGAALTAGLFILPFLMDEK